MLRPKIVHMTLAAIWTLTTFGLVLWVFLRNQH